MVKAEITKFSTIKLDFIFCISGISPNRFLYDADSVAVKVQFKLSLTLD
jgi:hypothetical protein